MLHWPGDDSITNPNHSFWDEPDNWLADVEIGEQLIFCRVKNGLAILDRIPHPKTGYYYRDVVKVKGPVGKSCFRDEEIQLYQAAGLHHPSPYPSFTFEAVAPLKGDYFKLAGTSSPLVYQVEFSYSDTEPNYNFREGVCAAHSIEKVTIFLNAFASLGEGRQVRNIREWKR